MKEILVSTAALLFSIQVCNAQAPLSAYSEIFPNGLYKSVIKGKENKFIGFEPNSELSKCRIVLDYNNTYDYNKTNIYAREIEIPSEIPNFSYKKAFISDTLYAHKSRYWVLIPSRQCIATYTKNEAGEISLDNILILGKLKEKLKSFNETAAVENSLKDLEARIAKFTAEEKERQDKAREQKELDRIETMKNTPKNPSLKENKEVLTLATASFHDESYRKDWVLVKAYINEKDNQEGTIVRNDYGAILRKTRYGYILIKDEEGRCYIKQVWMRQDYEGAGKYGKTYMTYGDKAKGHEVYCGNY